MSVHVEAWAVRQIAGSPARKLVLLALADNANDDGWLRWPQPQLPRRCEMTAPTLRSHVKKLVEGGLLELDGDWARLRVPWESEQP